MNTTNFNNGYQPNAGFSNNNYGNNYYSSTALPNNSMGNVAPLSPASPIGIGFVQGKIGAAAYPVMSSNTTVYLFDVQDQTKFYIKATDAFGMALPLREHVYHEVTNQSQITPIAGPIEVNSNDNTKESVTKEEFEELKAQLAALVQQNNKRLNQQKQRKERQEDV